MIGSECEAINNCLLVLRNILHIPENGRTQKNLQNNIVWNLFLQNIDQIILHLMINKHKVIAVYLLKCNYYIFSPPGVLECGNRSNDCSAL